MLQRCSLSNFTLEWHWQIQALVCPRTVNIVIRQCHNCCRPTTHKPNGMTNHSRWPHVMQNTILGISWNARWTSGWSRLIFTKYRTYCIPSNNSSTSGKGQWFFIALLFIAEQTVFVVPEKYWCTIRWCSWSYITFVQASYVLLLQLLQFLLGTEDRVCNAMAHGQVLFLFSSLWHT